MMGKASCLTGVFAVALGLSAQARAAEIPLPKVSFTAEMHVSVRDRKAIVVKLFNSPTNLRYEFSGRGQRRVILIDRLKKQIFVLDPRAKRYARRRYSVRADLVAQIPPRNPTLEKIGSEKIGKISVVKYQAKGTTAGGAPFNGYIWITAENVIVRIRGFVKNRSGTVRTLIELKKLKVGKIKPDIFQLPADFRLIEAKPKKK